jgi:hypothetical protein
METVKITVKQPVEIEIPMTVPNRKIRIVDTKTWEKPDANFSNIKFFEYLEEDNKVVFTADLDIFIHKRGYIIRGQEKTENNIFAKAHTNENYNLKEAAKKLDVSPIEFAEKCEFINIDEIIPIKDHKFTLSPENWIFFSKGGNIYDFKVYR